MANERREKSVDDVSMEKSEELKRQKVDGRRGRRKRLLMMVKQRKKGILVYCNKKGLSFFPLLYKYNANNRQASTQGEALGKVTLLIHRLLIREKDSLLVGSYYSFIQYRLRSPFSSLALSLAICFHCLLSSFFISHCNANNGYFSKAILVGSKKALRSP